MPHAQAVDYFTGKNNTSPKRCALQHAGYQNYRKTGWYFTRSQKCIWKTWIQTGLTARTSHKTTREPRPAGCLMPNPGSAPHGHHGWRSLAASQPNADLAPHLPWVSCSAWAEMKATLQGNPLQPPKLALVSQPPGKPDPPAPQYKHLPEATFPALRWGTTLNHYLHFQEPVAHPRISVKWTKW